MMRAVLVRQFGGIDQMKVATDVTIPTLGDKQVLIKMTFCGINPVDTYIREGAFGMLPDLPYVPGIDGAGVITSIGKLVTKFKPGDRVFACQTGQMGSLAEYVAVNEENAFPLDDKLSFEQGAAIGIPYFTAYRALFQKAKAKSGDRVLIHGASGAVGLAAVQIAKANGMHVTGTAGTQEGLDLVRTAGADAVYNHKEKAYLKKLQNEELFDVILEMLANVNLGNDLKLMKRHGRTIVVGSRGTVTVDPRELMGNESSVTGVALLTASPDEWSEIAAAIVDGIMAGWVKPIVDKVYSMEEAGQAHHDIIHSKGAKGKLIVKIQD
ncbi:quinone oxidoreductase-like isoform X2 [Palaemon carinicauda]|uniref:quinone oxidoreductase-like isoform X2 n=1 Tax=Palaemon carinicauda TaxID=392227 RepID=UPI0035B58B22